MTRMTSKRGARLWPILVVGIALVADPVWPAWRAAVLPGGDIRALAVDPGAPDFLLAGTASGQVFASHDGGERWALAGGELPFRGWVVSDLLFDPDSPTRVWAALRGLHSEAGFVAVSEDRGVTWTAHSDGLPGRQVYALAAAPGALYAATRQGVFSTHDGGREWQHLTGAHPEIQKVSSLLVDRNDPQRLYAGTWRRAYRSDDGGQTWHGVFDGMVLDSEVFTLTAAPHGEGEIWASTCGWVYRTLDSGGRWVRFQNGLSERRTPSFQALPSGVKLAGTVAGVYRSESDGGVWELVTPRDLVALTMVHHPARPERVFVGSEGAGIWRSDDGGRSFRPANRGLHAARIGALTKVGDEIIAAVRHSGPASGLYSSFDGGQSYLMGPVRLPTVNDLVSVGDAVYAATADGLFARVEGSWRRVEELGRRVVYQLAADGERVLARTAERLYALSPGAAGFAPLRFERGRPTSVALDRGAVWVTTAEGLFRLGDGGPVAAASPMREGRVEVVAGALMMTGAGELWMRRDAASSWLELGRGLRFLATGDDDHPLLLIEPQGALRLLSEDGTTTRRLAIAHPPEDLSAALLRDRHLLLGTAGFGVLVGDLEQVGSGLEPMVVGSSR